MEATLPTSEKLLGEFFARIEHFVSIRTKDARRFGDKDLYTQTIIELSMLVILWWAMYILDLPFWLRFCALAPLLGIVMAGLGFIMHEGAHGTFSSNEKHNKLVAQLLNLLGGNAEIWDEQHHGMHHANVNIQGKDGDIDTGKMGRFSPYQPHYWWHKYQHIYMPFVLYDLSYIAWKYYTDFAKAKKFGWSRREIVNMFFKKLFLNYIPFLIIPLCLDFSWQTLLVVFFADVVCGKITTYVFQPAHVVMGTEMYSAETEAKFDFLRQLKSTSNFATSNKWLTRYLCGLNFQVEHHSCSGRISFKHYPEMRKELKQLLREYGAEHLYHEVKTFWLATLSSWQRLKQLGAGEIPVAT